MQRFPKKVLVGQEEYSIAYVKQPRLNGERVLGWCSDTDKKISIKLDQRHSEFLATLVHELLHAIDHEYKIKLTHAQIYKLDHAITQVILDNFALHRSNKQVPQGARNKNVPRR